MTGSIRTRLTTALMLSLGGLLLAGGGALYPVIRGTLLSQFDEALQAKILALTLFPEVERQGIDLEFTEQKMPEFEATGSEYYQVWLRGETVIARSHSLGTASLPCRYGSIEKPLFWDLALPGGRRGRAVGIGFLPRLGEPNVSRHDAEGQPFALVVVLAKERATLDALLIDVGQGIAGLVAAMLVLALFLIWRALHTGLAPLDRLASRVRDMDAASLATTRLTVEGLPTELAPMARQLNALMERLHEAFREEQRLTADIAHELYTPLAELRTAAEVAQKWPDDPKATRQLAQDTLTTVQQLQVLVETLLDLARQRREGAPLSVEALDLVACWHDIAKVYAGAAETRNLVLQEKFPVKAVVQADKILLATILGNLLDNAIEHSPTGTRISCRISGGDAEPWQLCLENVQKDLLPSDLEHLFEPLWRKESARSQRTHTGLGLSLAQACAERLGISLHAELATPNLFRMALVIPA